MPCRLRAVLLAFVFLIAGRSFAAADLPAVIADLQPGSSIDREIAGTQTDEYGIALAAGEFARIDVDQKGIDVVVRVLSADGKLQTEIDNESRTTGQEHATIVAGAAEKFRLTVRPRYRKAAAGHYALTVAEVRPAAERDRLLYEAETLSTKALYLGGEAKIEEALTTAGHAVDSGVRALGPDDPYVGALLLRRGFVERALGHYAEARATFQHAADVSTAALGADDPQTALAVEGVGLTWLSEDEYARAEPFFQRALAIVEKTLGPHPRALNCLLDLSSLHQKLQDRQAAVSDLERAQRIGEKFFDPDEFQLIAITSNLGSTYRELNQYDRAEPLLRRALAGVEKRFGPEHYFVATPLRELAVIARERREYDKALDLLWRAEAADEKGLGLRHPDTAGTLLAIGNVYDDRGDHAEALDLQRRALDLLETVAGPYHDQTLSALNSVARTYAAEGNVACALEIQARADAVQEKDLELNLAIGSERQKLAYAESAEANSDRTISLHALQAPDDDQAAGLALAVVLQRKGRVLDAMSDTFSALRERLQPADQQMLDRLRSTTADLAKAALRGAPKTPPAEYRKRLESLEDEKEDLEHRISARSAEFRAHFRPVTVAAVRDAIPVGAALIEFSVYRPYDPRASTEADAYGAPHYIAYVLRRRGKIAWKDLGEIRTLDPLIAEWRAALRDPEQSRARGLARTLESRIMQPLLRLTGRASHLLISPDGQLDLIPFEALRDEHGRYLVEQHSFTYLTSGRDLLRMSVPRPSRSPAVIVADPAFGVPESAVAKVASLAAPRRSVTAGEDFAQVYFAPLAGTREEAQALHALFPTSRVLTGTEASKAAMRRLHAPRILHVATHGFFLETAPGQRHSTQRVRSGIAFSPSMNPLLRSGLALSGANRATSGDADGVLTAMEASTLDLWGTKLVTLSACDSGVGEVRNREGVYGLRRAFFLAGTETLVMSLWSVSDYVTRQMMTAYYDGLRRGLGRGEALRQAELAMLHRKGRSHPFYWASFIQAGDWRSLDAQ